MIAVNFEQANLMLAEDQPEYETLPVFVETREAEVRDPVQGLIKKPVAWEMTACFQLNAEEIAEIVKTGNIWYTQCLFGQPFQPVRMSTQNPFK